MFLILSDYSLGNEASNSSLTEVFAIFKDIAIIRKLTMTAAKGSRNLQSGPRNIAPAMPARVAKEEKASER